MKIENRQQFLILLTIATAALYLAVNYLATPLAGAWSARAKQIAALKQQVAEGRKLLQRDAGIRGRWSQMRTNALPENNSLAEQQLLKAIDGWAHDSGANISAITPQWKSDATNYTTLNCRVEAGGDLATLSRFIYDVEKDAMPLKVDTAELTARDNGGQQLSLSLQLNGLVLLNPKK